MGKVSDVIGEPHVQDTLRVFVVEQTMRVSGESTHFGGIEAGYVCDARGDIQTSGAARPRVG